MLLLCVQQIKKNALNSKKGKKVRNKIEIN